MRYADMLLTGRGVVIDQSRAVTLYRNAADAGVAEARFSLGNCLAEGRGVGLDMNAAVREWTLAAEAGHAPAQFRLATQLKGAKGPPGTPPPASSDAVGAARWFERAAKQGHVAAQANLARAYAAGEGVTRSPMDAYVWSTLALEGGVRETGGMGTMILTKLRGQAEKDLTPDQLTAARQRIAAFKPMPEAPAR
jgi:localization factor PodJL